MTRYQWPLLVSVYSTVTPTPPPPTPPAHTQACTHLHINSGKNKGVQALICVTYILTYHPKVFLRGVLYAVCKAKY